MQKDTVLKSISSVMLNPEGRNKAVTVAIESIVVNGETELRRLYRYRLIDTMKDLMVNFVGAFVFSVIGYFYVKNKGSNRLLRHFILTSRRHQDCDAEAGRTGMKARFYPENGI